ncbi:4-hydroxy-3-methylbut-2-en-1-yl diphosphate synthase [Verrucomicrobia bacterium LW23]|nr:4-hydroxy-3-methylbut-2-en-1-yl diphosphate synthase [Verrucomicrobia bacterium LW23]
MPYCGSPYSYARRVTRTVQVGGVKIGSEHPIVPQSMLTCDTMDTAACVRQTLELVAAGCRIVRITAPSVRDAANLQHIKRELLAAGCDVPIVADIHFKPDAALEAAKWVEKIRINPGNFADKKKFKVREYTDDEYGEELERIEETFKPLVDLCAERNVAMRIGTNHGSLSDRIMNRFGDSPLGMVESALEFARIARKFNFHNFVFSMKASNPKVMINAYRLLVARLAELGPDWNYPLHLGVTEAGDGEDGRIKSAIGIGALLSDGIGDTIRVSLTEDSIHEIPVARALISLAGQFGRSNTAATAALPPVPVSYDPYAYLRRDTQAITLPSGTEGTIGGNQPARVAATQGTYTVLEPKRVQLADIFPDFIAENCGVVEIDPLDEKAIDFITNSPEPLLVTVQDGCPLPPLTAYRHLAARIPSRHPILLKDTFHPPAPGEKPDVLMTLLHSSATIGCLLADGIGDAVFVRSEPGPGASIRLAFNILQSVGNRIFKTDYVACPSCGRTLFDLQSTTARIRASTSHLKGVKIAIMGCIVNGPGEMADADFGYVGGAPGKVNLYVGKTPVKFNIPDTDAVGRLIDLIKEHGKWVDAPAPSAEAPASAS